MPKRKTDASSLHAARSRAEARRRFVGVDQLTTTPLFESEFLPPVAAVRRAPPLVPPSDADEFDVMSRCTLTRTRGVRARAAVQSAVRREPTSAHWTSCAPSDTVEIDAHQWNFGDDDVVSSDVEETDADDADSACADDEEMVDARASHHSLGWAAPTHIMHREHALQLCADVARVGSAVMHANAPFAAQPVDPPRANFHFGYHVPPPSPSLVDRPEDVAF